MSGSPRLDPWVLDLLRCPLTGETLSGPVDVDGEQVLVTPSGLRYPVVDGVPVLLVDEARGVPASTGPDAPAADTAEGSA